MRWIPFLILGYLVVLLQTTAGRFLTFTTQAAGSIGPDLAAVVVVFVALYVRNWADGMLAAWALGLAVDLTAGAGGPGATAVGPMAVAYCLVAGLLYRVREAFFRERALTQAFLGGAFCLLTHAFWVTTQSLLAYKAMTWPAYGRTMLQAAGLSCYTAVLMPLGHFLLRAVQRWFLPAPAGPGARARR